jgi:potassium-transporting ATPase ATP-binding subunit
MAILTPTQNPIAGAPKVHKPRNQPSKLFDPTIVKRAFIDALRKLDPRQVAKNPVMFVVEIGSAVTTYFFVRDVMTGDGKAMLFSGQLALWLWFTVLFANFAEAMAEGRGKAQADALRKTKTTTEARRLLPNGREERVPAPALKKGDRFVCEAGDPIAADGDVIEGIASVDESAITGESAPVIRESGGDRSAVTGGTRVLSDRIVVSVSQEPGNSFLDRMIALVEGAERQKTPNEIALSILLAGLTIVFLFATVTLLPFAHYSVTAAGQGNRPDHSGPHCAAGLSHPHHHRRPPKRDRHCGHGPSYATQRTRDVRPRCRGCGRRQHFAS